MIVGKKQLKHMSTLGYSRGMPGISNNIACTNKLYYRFIEPLSAVTTLGDILKNRTCL
jgi:hypothetical protein